MQLKTIDKNKKLKFKCKKCGFCCDNTIIQLYPFDISNICKAIRKTTQELHKSGYTKFLLDKDKIPRCILNNKPSCKFKENNLCTIYGSRPIRCRLFPLGRYFEKGRTDLVIQEQRCIGFDTGKKQFVSEYIKDQEIEDRLSGRWNKYLISLKQKPKADMFPIIFRKIFYDFDDPVIKGYREKLRKEEDEEKLMENLYEIAEEMLNLT